MTKTLVLYVFHIYNDRVKHFINNCIFYDENVDFMIIANNNEIDFEAPSYVKKHIRSNIGYDFGAWSDALLIDNLYQNYNYFIFANSSIIGPFIPSYVTYKWTDIYINGLKDNIKLFGSTINTEYNPLTRAHVQTYVFSLDRETLNYLIECDIFTIKSYPITQHDAIQDKEVLMSRKIIEKGWNIGSLFSYYHNIDFTFKDKQPSDYNILFMGDIMYPIYRDRIWNEYDLVFIKGNR